MVIEVKDLTKVFELRGSRFNKSRARTLTALDRVSFSICQGQTLGLVGESGCGKSTTGRLIVKLLDPTGGKVLFEGKDISHFKSREMKTYRRNVQMIFQDSFSSLNPRMKVNHIIGEALDIHKLYTSKAEKKERIQSILSEVGLHPDHITRYPHEFSGGQRQRINIARALCLKPKVIVCDEAVSALDVSIQAQIINLLNEIKEKYHLSYLFISHDLSVIKHMSDRVAVMYLGKIVEIASKKNIFNTPLHPYTKALISVVPNPDPNARRKKIRLKGEISQTETGQGCCFANRCAQVMDRCWQAEPALKTVGTDHQVACFLTQ